MCRNLNKYHLGIIYGAAYVVLHNSLSAFAVPRNIILIKIQFRKIMAAKFIFNNDLIYYRDFLPY